MELLNLRAIPIAYERRAYNITPKELNIIKNTPYRDAQKGHSLSKSISLLNHKGLLSLKKFILKKIKLSLKFHFETVFLSRKMFKN